MNDPRRTGAAHPTLSSLKGRNLQVAPTRFVTSITKEAINQLPLIRYDGPIELIQDESELRDMAASIENETVVGFDVETRPTFRKGQNFRPAIVQLAGSRSVFIVQLRRFETLTPLSSILSDARIIKTGVAVSDDLRKLNETMAFEPRGFQELSVVTRRLGILNTGLRSLAAILLRRRVSKGAQTSNWNRLNLTDAQIRYAATDAWISRMIYLRLIELGLTGDSD